MIVIVGAGLAGLVCAKELARRGINDFVLLEKHADPGGRVRTFTTEDGFTLDRGFQVLLDSYPAARRYLNLRALEPCYFESGAILVDGDKRWTASNPLRQPGDFVETATGELFSPADKARLVALVAETVLMPDRLLLGGTASEKDISTAQLLWKKGFSPTAIEGFFRPFFGGVFLDNRLGTSSALFRYYLKKFTMGRALLPAGGMGQIGRQLAASLPASKVRYGCAVERIALLGNRAAAVVLQGGEKISLDALLLCTDQPATAALLERPAARVSALGTTVVYYETPAPLYERAMLVLPSGRGRLVRHFAQITNVAPSYAPTNHHLLATTVLDRAGLGDAELTVAARREIAEIFPAMAVARPVAVVDVPYAQRQQPPGFARALPPVPIATHLANVFLAGDQTTACSIQSAMESGEQAATFFARGNKSFRPVR